MEIRFVGTGGAFDVEYGNSSAIVNCHQKNILIDCGHTVFPKLVQLNLIQSLDYILITHLHDDHAGSLSTLIFYLYFNSPQKKVKLLVPDKFYNELENYLNFSQKNVHQYITFERLPAYIHAIDTFNRHYPNMQTFSYVFSEYQEHIVYSGDLNDASFLMKEVKNMNLKGKTTVFHDVTFNPLAKTAHAYYQDIEPFMKEYTIWGYHCNPKLKPKDCKLPLVIENPQFIY